MKQQTKTYISQLFLTFVATVLVGGIVGCVAMAAVGKFLAVPLITAALKGGSVVKEDPKTQDADVATMCYCGHTSRVHEDDGAGECTKCKCVKFTWLRELNPEEDPDG